MKIDFDKLGINDENDLYNYIINNIRYGTVDKILKEYDNTDDNFFDKYMLQLPYQIIQTGVGTCWDQVELIREFCEYKKYISHTFFGIYNEPKNSNNPTHTFLVFEKGDKYFWIETAWYDNRGIHKYNSLDELISDFKKRYYKFLNVDNPDEGKFEIHEYKKITKNMGAEEFLKHVGFSKIID